MGGSLNGYGRGLPVPARIISDLLGWADFPKCRESEAYKNEAATFYRTYQRILAGAKAKARVRNGP